MGFGEIGPAPSSPVRRKRLAASVSHHRWLALLAALFVLRVLGQLVQVIQEVRFLPALEQWQGSSLPYPALLIAQILIIGLQVVCIQRVRYGLIRPRLWKVRLLYWFGGVYLAMMTVRLLGDLTFFSNNDWLNKSIPAVFHGVLAAYVLVLGHHISYRLRKYSDNESASRNLESDLSYD